MKPTNATLNAILAGRMFYTADLYVFTLANGTVLRYAGGGTQLDLTYQGNVYGAGGIGSVSGSGSARLWQPTDIAGLQAWYSADVGVYTDAGITLATDGQTVQQWNDRSGNGANLSLDGSGIIFLKTGGPTKTPTVNFATRTGAMTTGRTAVKMGTAQASGFFVGSSHVSGSAPRMLSFEGATGGRDWDNTQSCIFAYANNGPASGNVPAFQAYQGTNAIVDGDLSFAAISLDTFYRAGSIYDGVNNTMYLNNVASPSVAQLSPGSVFAAKGSVGVGGYIDGSSTEFLVGNISEALVTNTAISATDRATLDQYLAWKWFGIGTPPMVAGPSGGPYFDRKDNKAKMQWKTGSGNSQIMLDVVPGAAIVQSLNFLDAIRCGLFDNADFQLFRAFQTQADALASRIQTGCAVLMFQGRVAEVDADRSLATFLINDYRDLFSQQLPRNLFAASCANTFGDTSCTVVVANFSENGVVQTGTTQTSIATTLTRASDYYDMGKVTFTSGVLAGQSFGVSTWIQGTPGIITPVQALPKLPAVGDKFTIFPGCDKTFTGGCTKYNNTPNFRGFPYVPAPETAL